MKSKAISYPYIVWMILFTVVPLALVAFFAFTNKSGEFSFANITDMLEYMNVLLYSLWVALLSTAICLLLGYPLAYMLSRKRSGSQQIFVLLLMLPMWMNFLLRTYAWMTLLEDKGLINKFFELLGLPTVHMINTQGAVLLGMVYNYLPFLILPIYNSLCKIDRQYTEAAQDLGANSKQVFRKVIFPMSLPGVISGITMVFVPAVSTFIISELLGGGKTPMLVGDLINLQILGGADNLNLGSAMSLIMMILILVSMGIMRHFEDDEMEVLI